jgi:protein-S-isoprenylcysteine O-methyltransferase Ste14
MANTQNTQKPLKDQTAVRRRMIQVLLTFLIQAALLFTSAGTLVWPIAWVLQAEYIAVFLLNRYYFLRDKPELIAERGKPEQGVKKWDKIITSVIMLFNLSLLVIIGLDKRFTWSPDFPLILQITGLFLITGGQLLFSWAMASNPFFSTLVRIQEDRGQIVAQQGPYRFVRHPGYVGYIIFTLATPLALSSLWGFIPAGVISTLLVLRTHLEDKTLLAELDGYDQFSNQTKYRLIPGVW